MLDIGLCYLSPTDATTLCIRSSCQWCAPPGLPREEEEIRMCAVNGAIVYGGLDQKFNELRVFPPFDMDYPDLIKNKENFYDLIGCPHLKEKFEM